MTRARVALAAGLMLMLAAIGLTLTRSPLSVAWSDSTPLEGTFAEVVGGSQACQAHEELPQSASAVRLSLYAGLGPRVSVKVLSGDHVLTSGVRGAGWRGQSPTVPLLPVSQSASDVKLCFRVGRSEENVGLDGSAARPGEGTIAQDGRSLGVKMRIEYLRGGNRSWLSLLPSVFRRAELGRWTAGAWIPLLVLLLVATMVSGAAWLTARELR